MLDSLSTKSSTYVSYQTNHSITLVKLNNDKFVIDSY